jgi:hypothetical protein
MLSYFIFGFFVGVTVSLLALKGWLCYQYCKALKEAHDEGWDMPN